jgi:hypothetical protein
MVFLPTSSASCSGVSTGAPSTATMTSLLAGSVLGLSPAFSAGEPGARSSTRTPLMLPAWDGAPRSPSHGDGATAVAGVRMRNERMADTGAATDTGAHGAVDLTWQARTSTPIALPVPSITGAPGTERAPFRSRSSVLRRGVPSLDLASGRPLSATATGPSLPRVGSTRRRSVTFGSRLLAESPSFHLPDWGTSSARSHASSLWPTFAGTVELSA